MNRNPEFIVCMNNRADSCVPAYARRIRRKWMLTGVDCNKHVFNTFWEAAKVRIILMGRFSHNQWVDVWIERIDLCDSILTDIDNMAEL